MLYGVNYYLDWTMSLNSPNKLIKKKMPGQSKSWYFPPCGAAKGNSSSSIDCWLALIRHVIKNVFIDVCAFAFHFHLIQVRLPASFLFFTSSTTPLLVPSLICTSVSQFLEGPNEHGPHFLSFSNICLHLFNFEFPAFLHCRFESVSDVLVFVAQQLSHQMGLTTSSLHGHHR